LPNFDEYIQDLDKYFCSCVFTKFSRQHSTLIVDDLVSISAVRMLKAEGVDIKVFFLVAPYELRIERIMKRQGCSRSEAELEEHKKYLRKIRLGINEVAMLAEYELDGSKSINEILASFPLSKDKKNNFPKKEV
jgi:dephospho-CoA kinase